MLSRSRLFDQTPPPPLSDFENLAKRTADAPLAIPRALPAQVRSQTVSRYDDTPVYPRKHICFAITIFICCVCNVPECTITGFVAGD